MKKNLILGILLLFVLSGCTVNSYYQQSNDTMTTTTKAFETTIIETKKVEPIINLTITYLENFWASNENVKVESLSYEKIYNDRNNTYDLNFTMKGIVQTAPDTSSGIVDYAVKDDEGYSIKTGSFNISFTGMNRYDKFKKTFSINGLEPSDYKIQILGHGSLNENWAEKNDVTPIPVITLH